MTDKLYRPSEVVVRIDGEAVAETCDGGLLGYRYTPRPAPAPIIDAVGEVVEPVDWRFDLEACKREMRGRPGGIAQYHGYWCLVTRAPHGFPWCGYVRLEPGHPWHGMPYGSIPADVHGGLTFSDAGQGGDKTAWYIGFDFGHAWDLDDEVTLAECVVECARLVDQAIRAWGKQPDEVVAALYAARQLGRP